MKKKKTQKLDHGLYRIFWKKKYGGKMSLAAVGSTTNGTRWFAPCNWVSTDHVHPQVVSTDWSRIKRVELVETK